ncbi:MAG: PhoH family protein [Prevotella sp.]|nr:PhoH family protein [Prevotella sp.]
MIEKHIVLEDIDPVILYGIGNDNLQMIKSLFPKLRIAARDNVMRLLGDEEEMAKAEESIEALRKHVLKYNSLHEEDIIDIVNGHKTKADAVKDVVVYNINGKPIKGRSANQQQLIDAFDKNDMIFAVGPAGTGKTYLSIALAVKALKEKAIRKIILSRPAVEAGEKLGFLPGDMKEKIDPYLQPLYDALEDMIPGVKLQDMMEKNVIQIAPLAFMRGRTLSDAVVILDEAQNTTTAQLRMFLTRMGTGTKMIITGDMTQIDLPKGQTSGLKEALKILPGIDSLAVINFEKKDIVRHKLVTKIVAAYESYDKERIAGKDSEQKEEMEQSGKKRKTIISKDINKNNESINKD